MGGFATTEHPARECGDHFGQSEEEGPFHGEMVAATPHWFEANLSGPTWTRSDFVEGDAPELLEVAPDHDCGRPLAATHHRDR